MIRLQELISTIIKEPKDLHTEVLDEFAAAQNLSEYERPKDLSSIEEGSLDDDPPFPPEGKEAVDRFMDRRLL